MEMNSDLSDNHFPITVSIHSHDCVVSVEGERLKDSNVGALRFVVVIGLPGHRR
jgi:hypothetical protein